MPEDNKIKKSLGELEEELSKINLDPISKREIEKINNKK